MKKLAHPITTIDEYIQLFSPPVQQQLTKIRELIKSIAPTATEAMSYQIPTFKLRGNLVHFAAFTSHIGFYPGAQALEVFKLKLTNYKTSKGTIQFPLEESLPLDLIREIVEFRVAESLKK